MNVGVVGANGKVGTELCFLLGRMSDATVVPVVRNELGTHFLSHNGFDCRVRDVSDPDDAGAALEDLDAVVVAAFAWQYSHEGFQSRQARRTNERLVRHAVEHSPPGASVVYFSSQAAFGDELGSPDFGDWTLYTREKRNAERTLRAACEEFGKPGYALRLGFVHGANQDFTRDLVARLSDGGTFHVPAGPDRPSNVLHTVTLADAVLDCARGRPSPGTYSLVDEPQWTWREVLSHYAPAGTRLVFHPDSGGSGLLSRAVSRGWEAIEARQGTLRTMTIVVPDRINRRLFQEYLKHQRSGEIADLERRRWLDDDAFEYDPIPGPFLPDLRETERLLERHESAIESVFTPEHDSATAAAGTD